MFTLQLRALTRATGPSPVPGFSHYARVTVPLPVIQASATTLNVQVDITSAALRTESFGGFVKSASGYDIQFFADEFTATPLKHDVLSYSGSAGALSALVRITRIGGDEAEAVIRIGNSSITAPTEDPAGTVAAPVHQTINTDLLFAVQSSPFAAVGQFLAIDAPHIQQSANISQSVDFPVLSAWPGGTITSAGTPSAGTAAIAPGGTAIRYTAPGTAQIVTWAYTVSRQGVSDTGYLRARVVSSTPGPAPGTGDYPAATDGIFNVPGNGTITQAIADVAGRPGRHIVLANGSYAGFTMPHDGTTVEPIVIRAANLLGATITGNITINGADVILWGVKLGPNFLVINGSRSKARRVQMLGRTGGPRPYQVELNGQDNEIGFYEIGDTTGAGVGSHPAQGARRPYIHHGHHHDCRGNGTNGSDQIGFGQGRNDSNLTLGAVVEYVLFEDCNLNGENELISIKSSGNTLRYLHGIRSMQMMCGRHGENNTYEGCRNVQCASPMGFNVRDQGGRLLGCYTDADIRLQSGNMTQADWDAGLGGAGDAPAAEDCLLVGTTAQTFVIGAQDLNNTGSVVARNNRLEKCTGPVTLQRQTGTTTSATTSVIYPAPITLTAADVGPNAAGGGGGGGGPGGEDPGSNLETETVLATEPDRATSWNIMKAAASAGWTQDPTFLFLDGGTLDIANGNLALVSLQTFSGKRRVEFDYMPLENNETTSGVFCNLYFLRGLGTGGFPANLSGANMGTRPDDASFVNDCAGFRISYDTRNPNAAQNQEIRCRYLPGDGSNPLIDPLDPKSFVFPRNQWSRIRCQLDGNSCVVAVRLGGATEITQTFTSAQIAQLATNVTTNVLLMVSDGRQARVRDFSIFQPI